MKTPNSPATAAHLGHCGADPEHRTALGTGLEPGTTVGDRGRLASQVCAPPRHRLLSSSKESAGRPARACKRPGAQQGRVPATVRPPGRPGAARAQYSRSLWGMEPPVHPVPPKRTRHSLQECPPLGKSPLGHLSASVPDQSCLPRPPPRRCRPRPPPAPPPSSCSGSPPPPPAPPRPRRRQRDRARFHLSPPHQASVTEWSASNHAPRRTGSATVLDFRPFSQQDICFGPARSDFSESLSFLV